MLRAPGAASALTDKVAVSVVGLTTFTALAVTPVPLTFTVAPLRKFAPDKVIGKVSPCTADGMLIEESAGPAAITVKGNPALVPAGVETVTVRAPAPAP